MAQAVRAAGSAQGIFASFQSESVAALRSSGINTAYPAEFVATVCELAALDGSLGWLAAVFGTAAASGELVAPSVRGSGTLRGGRLTGRWESVVGARHADRLLLFLDDGSAVLVPVAAVDAEPADGRLGLAGTGTCAVTATDLAVRAGGIRPADPALAVRTATGAAAAVLGCADGVWRGHVEQVRARLTLSHGGGASQEVSDESAAQVARAASDIDAARLQVTAAVAGDRPATAWSLRQAVGRAQVAADRLLGNSRHALDAADPVSLRWRDVQVGRGLAESLIARAESPG